MKPRCSNRRNQALTLTEVVVVVLLAFLTLVFFPWPEPRAQKKAARIMCLNNLKQIGLAFRIWADDNSGKFPMQISVANGGTKELAAAGDAVATFQIMSNELATPRLLFCPADTNHVLAKSFGANLTAKNVSYFTSLDTDTNHPQQFLSGDDNFAIDGRPVKPGLLFLMTNASVSWTATRHLNGGNIGLADSSVWSTDDKQLVQRLVETGLATNRLAIP